MYVQFLLFPDKSFPFILRITTTAFKNLAEQRLSGGHGAHRRAVGSVSGPYETTSTTASLNGIFIPCAI